MDQPLPLCTSLPTSSRAPPCHQRQHAVSFRGLTLPGPWSPSLCWQGGRDGSGIWPQATPKVLALEDLPAVEARLGGMGCDLPRITATTGVGQHLVSFHDTLEITQFVGFLSGSRPGFPFCAQYAQFLPSKPSLQLCVACRVLTQILEVCSDRCSSGASRPGVDPVTELSFIYPFVPQIYFY